MGIHAVRHIHAVVAHESGNLDRWPTFAQQQAGKGVALEADFRCCGFPSTYGNSRFHWDGQASFQIVDPELLQTAFADAAFMMFHLRST